MGKLSRFLTKKAVHSSNHQWFFFNCNLVYFPNLALNPIRINESQNFYCITYNYPYV